MFVLACVFFFSANSEPLNKTLISNFSQHFFFVGIFLSCTNFIQIPFWLSWNLYLLNGNYIEVSKYKKYFYVFGTVTGTFFGMLVFILSLNFLTLQTDFLSKYLTRILIPLVFVGLGILQGIKFYKKYSK